MHTLSLSLSQLNYGYPLRYIYVLVFGFIRGVLGFIWGGGGQRITSKIRQAIRPNNSSPMVFRDFLLRGKNHKQTIPSKYVYKYVI